MFKSSNTKATHAKRETDADIATEGLRPLKRQEQDIYDHVARGFIEGVPHHLIRSMRVYAILSYQWELTAGLLGDRADTKNYRAAQMLSYFGSQAERAKASIDKEIERQREAKERVDAAAGQETNPIHKIYNAG